MCVRLGLHGEGYIAVLEGGDKYKGVVLARWVWKAPTPWPIDLLQDNWNVYQLSVHS